ncbi:glycoside hydrolase [Rhizopogon vinicolor AM-OR11-026]|uniref:mannan endo-1,4-beta-mannosidase n=1 Tax=Rhizopogon vinicolor AM-OR11-026 TaxID=1314800 RepID=A0A1B7N0B6_9AGAM|nr:glycoside hydrolase [Rhizopogon vinicolor AM-OR11-026]
MHFLLYFWLLTSISLCLAVTPSRTIAKRDPTSFVSSTSSGFSVNGSSLRYVGTNLYWLPTLESNDDIWNVLANISSLGIKVVRLWAFNDVETIPDTGTWFQLVQNGTTTINDGPNGLQKLDTVIQMAEQQGLYVILSLTNNWNPVPNTTTTGNSTQVLASTNIPRNTLSNDFGGMDLYVRQFGLQYHDDFYTHAGILTAFQNYTQQIVTRYADSPAVFSWELANDARCNSTQATSPTCTTQTVTQWHATMASFIATLDSNHIVSAGTSGYQCTDCQKLYPITPTVTSTPSPAPGKKRKVTPLTNAQIVRKRAESKRRSRAAAIRAGTLKEDGIRIRGRWVSTMARRQEISTGSSSTTDGSAGVDSQDILNIPNIGFGSFQVFPDQESYGTDDPNLDPVDNKINSSLLWIQQSAQSAAAVGKPVVLTGFGLVTQDNLQSFVPFNMTYAPYASMATDVVNTTTSFANSTQQETGYSSFLENNDTKSIAVANSAGLAGVMQYQWGSTGITQSSSTIQLDSSTSPSTDTGDTPNDGYSIANNTAIQQILMQGAQAMAANPL